MKLYTTPADEAVADRLYESLGLEGERTLVMAPGAAFGMAKCWPPERFALVARRARDEMGLRTLVLCAPNELPVARVIVETAGGAAVAPPEPLPGLGAVKAIVRRARAMVTNDSGLRHFAAAYDIPVVAIFGPTHVNWTETWFRKETKLQAPVSCGPCQKRVCPEGHLQCMADVTPDEAAGALADALREFPDQAPREDNIIG
jgi:heptosyltransferase-2